MKLKKGIRDIPTSKTDKDYKEYIKSCLTKKVYKRRSDAIQAAMFYGSHYKEKNGVYFCSFCGKYHLTTHPRKSSSRGSKIVCMENGELTQGSRHSLKIIKKRERKEKEKKREERSRLFKNMKYVRTTKRGVTINSFGLVNDFLLSLNPKI